MKKRIAYIMSRFPHLPETFILREMTALAKRGWEIALFPIIFQDQELLHEEAKPWVEKAERSAFFSRKIFMENLKTFVKNPVHYFRILFLVILKNVPSRNFLFRALILFPKVVFFAGEIQSKGISHIHVHYATHPALAAWIIKQFTGINYSITVHAHDIYVDQTMLAEKVEEAVFVAAISEYNRRFLVDHVGEHVKEKIAIVHCGINPDWYQQFGKTSDSSTGFDVINVGSLQPYKGQKFLIEAVRVLIDKGVPVCCRIVGEGQERGDLEKRISELDLQDDVLLLGAKSQSEVAALMPQADCFVQPSIIVPSGKMEGIPVVLMEALACGLPVVATQISGIPELIRNNISGLLVKEKDPSALADALYWIWQHPDEARNLGYTGRSIVLKEFDLESNVEKLEEMFRQMGS